MPTSGAQSKDCSDCDAYTIAGIYDRTACSTGCRSDLACHQRARTLLQLVLAVQRELSGMFFLPIALTRALHAQLVIAINFLTSWFRDQHYF